MIYNRIIVHTYFNETLREILVPLVDDHLGKVRQVLAESGIDVCIECMYMY